jgi:hypothetical protein
MMRAGAELFRDMKEALDIVGRLIRDSELTHHPYETLLEIVKVINSRRNTIIEVQEQVLVGQLNAMVALAKAKLVFVPEGYQRSHAEDRIKSIVEQGY